MKPPPFDYLAPRTLDEALAALASGGGEVLAGGQSLMPLLNLRERSPALLVDINRLPGLDRVERRDGAIEIGALVRHSRLGELDDVRARCPLLAEAARHIGHRPVRNRGTFGGSIAHCHPAAELAAVAAAADAEVELVSRAGARTLRFNDFALGAFKSARRDDELITAVRLRSLEGFAWGFHEITRREREYALAGAVAALDMAGDGIRSARVALFGAGPVPRRLPELEQALVGALPDGLDLAALAAQAAEIAAPAVPSDRYRCHLAGVAVRRALSDALARRRKGIG